MPEPSADLIFTREKAADDAQEILRPVGTITEIRIENPTTGKPDLVGFWPDGTHIDNQKAATIGRFGRKMEKIDGDEKKSFTSFAKTFVRQHFNPLVEEEIPSFEEWMFNKTTYSSKRKENLAKVLLSTERMSKKTPSSNSFIKREGYEKPKNARGINSYTDESKVLIGRFQHAIDKKLFSTKWFVKGKNPNTWPGLLRERFGDNGVMGTDFTSFEAHHRDVFADVVHYAFMHMIRDCGLTNDYKRLLSRVMKGTNVTEFSRLRAEIDERLMSGAMWTSSANGLLNLLIMSYLVARSKAPDVAPELLAINIDDYFTGYVEGDDGICVDEQIDESIIQRLGIILKFEKHSHFTRASFCGIICDDSNLETPEVLKDPIKVLRNFFILDARYIGARKSIHKGLLRAKALSLMCNHKNCPIIGPLCDKICELTRGHSLVATSENDFKQHYIDEAVQKKLWTTRSVVTERARILVEEVFNITCAEQLRIESEINNSTGRIYVDLSRYAHVDQARYLDLYVKRDNEVCMRPEIRPFRPVILDSIPTKRGDAAAQRKSVVKANRTYDTQVDLIEHDESVYALALKYNAD